MTTVRQQLKQSLTDTLREATNHDYIKEKYIQQIKQHHHKAFSIIFLTQELNLIEHKSIEGYYNWKPTQELMDWLDNNNIEYTIDDSWANTCVIIIIKPKIPDDTKVQFKLTFSLNIESFPAKPSIWNGFGLCKY